MFNLSGFNQNRFNIPETIDAVLLRTNAFETVNASCGLAQNVSLTTNAAEQLTGSMEMLQGTLLQMPAIESAEAVSFRGAMLSTILQKAEAEEKVAGSIAMGAILYPSNELSEEMTALCRLGSNTRMQSASSEEVSAALTLGADVSFKNAAYEMLSAIADAENNVFRTVLLDVTLQPGDELVLDSDLFTLVKNGENVLHQHSGDWVHLTRRTRKMQIDTGNAGALSSSVFFTERYL